MSNNSKSPKAAWEGLSPDTRRRVIIQTVAYVVLVVFAFRSLSKQSEADLRGPKSLWRGVIPASLTNFRAGSAWMAPVGPLLYFIVGKRWHRAD